MTDIIEIFLGDIRCALQRFEPKPGDVFVLTVKGYISHEQQHRIQSDWTKHIPYHLGIVVMCDTEGDSMKVELIRAAELPKQ